jgi:hypothetical protein
LTIPPVTKTSSQALENPESSTNTTLRRLFTPWRVKWYSRGALFALAAVYLFALVTSHGSATVFGGRISGDFVSFYTAGRIIADGKAEQLYSGRLQLQYQEELIGEPGVLIPFLYPPHFALLYTPLAKLPFQVAYAIQTLAMLAALAIACVLFQRLYPNLIGSSYFLFFVALTAHPILRSIMGGQNTMLSVLLITLCWFSVVHRRQYHAGIYLGLLFFKPQFALPLAGLFFLSGRWRIWLSAAITAVTLLMVGTAVIGINWVNNWHDLVNRFYDYSMVNYTSYIVSWNAFASAMFGAGDGLAVVFGWVATALTIATISWVWLRGRRTGDLNAQIGLASICIIMLAPQTLFYDAGIALIAVVVLLGRLGRLDPILVFGIWITSYLQLLSPFVGFSFSLVPLLLILTLSLTYLWSPATVGETSRFPAR